MIPSLLVTVNHFTAPLNNSLAQSVSLSILYYILTGKCFNFPFPVECIATFAMGIIYISYYYCCQTIQQIVKTGHDLFQNGKTLLWNVHELSSC